MKNAYFDSPLDYNTLMHHVEALCAHYDSIELSYLGNSLFSRRIPMLSVGRRGAPEIFYVAGHHATEWLCTGVLLSFIAQLCEMLECGGRAFGISLEYLTRTRRIVMVPQLNVDGTDIHINGLPADCPIKDRLERAAGGDFSRWQANGRGVDLNHNYNARFYEYKTLEREMGIFSAAPTRYSGEYPESEPESAALANYLRYSRPRLVLSLHSQGEVIYGADSGVQGAREIAGRLGDACGYALDTPTGAAACGGLCDWYADECSAPALTLECGRGENPLPIESGAGIYARLRRALFTAASMV